jgi:hypothetical protein
MKSAVIIAAATIALCFGTYVFGYAYERSLKKGASRTADATPIATSPTIASNFGDVFYEHLATMSFADLYEALRSAPAHVREGWLTQIVDEPETPHKIAALNGFFRALVQADAQQAAELVINLPRHRGPAMDAMIAAAPPAAMPLLAEMLLKVPDTARNFQLTDHIAVVIDEWAQVDPDAVAQFLDRRAGLHGFGNPEYADALVRQWAGIDHDAAWKWLESSSNDTSAMFVESWLLGWFEADRQDALKFALDHIHDAKVAEASTSLAPALFQQNDADAKQFIEKLPTVELRQTALSALASQAGEPDYAEDYRPDAMAKFIVQFSLVEWPERFSDVINRWRYRDIPGLLNWISALPPEQQGKVIDNFPEPISYELEQEFLPVLALPISTVRTRLLQQMTRHLESEGQSQRDTIEKMKLSVEQKHELLGLLSDSE